MYKMIHIMLCAFIIIFIHAFNIMKIHIICILQDTIVPSIHVPILTYIADVFFVLYNYVLYTYRDHYVLICSLLVSSDWPVLISILPLIFRSQYSTNEGSNEGSRLQENEIHVRMQHPVVTTDP